MPTFEKRCAVLENALRKNETFSADQAGRMLSRLIGLFDGRDSALTAMQLVLTTGGKEELSDEYRNKADLFVERWLNPFSNILSGISDVDPALDRWREQQVMMEKNFHTGLLGLGLGDARDELIRFANQLEKASADAQYRWDTMSSEARRLEELEQEASKKMMEIITQALHDGTDAWARWGEAATQVIQLPKDAADAVKLHTYAALKGAGVPESIVDFLKGFNGNMSEAKTVLIARGYSASDVATLDAVKWLDVGSALSSTILDQIQPGLAKILNVLFLYNNLLWNPARAKYCEQVNEYRSKLPNHGVVLVSLGTTRRQVEDFLRDNGLDKARAVFEKVNTGLDGWVASFDGDNGCGADARAWVEPVREAFKCRFEDITNAFSAFILANQGRFIGQPKSDVVKELIQTEVWKDRENNFLNIGLDVRIKEWREGLMTVSNQFETAASQLFLAIGDLPEAIRINVEKKTNAYWTESTSKVQAAIAGANKQMEEMGLTISEERRRNDIDRESLKRQLES